MKSGIDALAARCRVVTFSLADEPSCGSRFDEAAGFGCYVEQVREAMDQAGLERATICGISYGGLIAAAFAARYPERASALVLISALPPTWKPNARVRFYLRAPRLLMPVFMVASLQLYGEMAATHGGVWKPLTQAARHGWNVLTHMFSPSRMANRVHLLARADFAGVNALRVPALVIAGEEALDRIVPVRATRQYVETWPHARFVIVERTGHLGFITRPDVFADLIAPFAGEHAPSAGEGHQAAASRRRVG